MLQVLNEIQTLGGEPEHISDGLNKYYEKEKKSPDDFLKSLDSLALGEQDGQESCHRLILRLKAALSQFDNASIYTIHGFCQRVLRDYAFFVRRTFGCRAVGRLARKAADSSAGLLAAESGNRCHIGTIGF